jgi:hypothetical protein
VGLQFVAARLFARAQPAAQQAAIYKQQSSKVLYILTLHWKCTRALTFEKFCQASMGLGAFRTCPWACLREDSSHRATPWTCCSRKFLIKLSLPPPRPAHARGRTRGPHPAHSAEALNLSWLVARY